MPPKEKELRTPEGEKTCRITHLHSKPWGDNVCDQIKVVTWWAQTGGEMGAQKGHAQLSGSVGWRPSVFPECPCYAGKEKARR